MASGAGHEWGHQTLTETGNVGGARGRNRGFSERRARERCLDASWTCGLWWPNDRFHPSPGSTAARCHVLTLIASSTEWQVGLALGSAVIAVAAVIVIVIVLLAIRIARQAKVAEQAVEVVRGQTGELGGIARINDSGVRILHAARSLRKVAVGK